jgi:hypothetical protein
MTLDTTTRPRRAYIELFVVSFLILFLELACIRWFAAYVVFLTFFTNVVLLASFLGMSVGCLSAPRKADYVHMAPALLLLAVSSAVFISLFYLADTSIMVDVGNQTSPAQIYFGADYRFPNTSRIIVPVEAVVGYFFVLVALIFIGIGQVMGRRFDMIPNKVYAYTANIFGSLVGIVAFAAISLLRLPPFVWFAVAFACLVYFLFERRRKLAVTLNVICLGLTLFLVVGGNWNPFIKTALRVIEPSRQNMTKTWSYNWSPYYWVVYDNDPARRDIGTNGIGHQTMLPVGSRFTYMLPYLLSRDSERPPIKDVLIIGAGSGNDVSNACWAGVEKVDAVEIDPVIYDLGRRFHPNHPYQDSRVHIHLNDGRNFLKNTDQKYDLIVYALVDSLMLHSGYSSIRLENYLFTEQAFADVRAHLKENGIFVMYNYFRQGWLVERLRNMARQEFDSEPILFSLPYRAQIPAAGTPNMQFYTMIIVGDTAKLKEKFAADGAYWVRLRNGSFDFSPGSATFGKAPPKTSGPEESIEQIAPATIEDSAAGRLLPNDNRPFLYLADRLKIESADKFPFVRFSGALMPPLSIRGIGLMGVLSLAILLLFTPRKKIRFNWTMFFLGAGFMLLETKSVVHLALLFGSTWMVNSIVFFAILVMVLLANLYVLRARPQRLTFFYAALVIALVVNVFFNLNTFLGLPGIVRIAGSCLIVFAPIFFAGVIFATFFRESANPDMDMGSNIAGVVLGGLAENLSLSLGFNHLMWIAIGFYLLSRLLKGRIPQRA